MKCKTGDWHEQRRRKGRSEQRKEGKRLVGRKKRRMKGREEKNVPLPLDPDLTMRDGMTLYTHLPLPKLSATLIHNLPPSHSFCLKERCSLKRHCQHSVVMSGQSSGTSYLPSPQEFLRKSFVFSQMVINNTTLQVFKDSEAITFYSLPIPNPSKLSTWNTFSLPCPFLSTPFLINDGCYKNGSCDVMGRKIKSACSLRKEEEMKKVLINRAS